MRDQLPFVKKKKKKKKKIWVSTSGRSFSALRRLMTYLTNTMKQDQLNGRILVHGHKTLTDTIDPLAIVKTFASANEQRKGYFGKFKYTSTMTSAKIRLLDIAF